MKKTPVCKGFTRGLLTVLRASRVPKNVSGHRRWKVRCECGVVFEVWGYNLVKEKGFTKSCGKKKCRTAVPSEPKIPGSPSRTASYVLETKRIQAELKRCKKAKIKP